ncbi:MAG: acyloxyacyl hydrolase [Bacteroidales bacterium]
MPRQILCVLTILLFFVSAEAQNKDANPLYLSFKPQYGFIIPHSPAIKDISDTNPFGFDMEAGWNLLQKKDWNRCNCYSRAGFLFNHTNFNYPEVLGASNNLSAFVEPYLNHRGFVLTSVRMGAGLSYITKVYDEQSNPENMFFSSPLSFLVHIDLNAVKYLSDNWFLHAYFKYNHISNGGSSKPNKGMNFPTFGLGAGYSFKKVNFKDREKIKSDIDGPVKLTTRLFGTLKQVDEENQLNDRNLSMGILLRGQKKFSAINAVNVGVEGVSDFAFKKKMEELSLSTDHRQISFLVGHSFVFSKFDFTQYWGTYIYAPAYENKNFFQRYSLSYEFFDNFSFGVTLKAHAQVAENFNLLLGYTFGNG